MGKFFVKLGNNIIKFNQLLKSKWNQFLMKLTFK